MNIDRSSIEKYHLKMETTKMPFNELMEFFKLWYIQTKEYFSSIKKKELLMYRTSCMKLNGYAK